jgi:hypothetical protein
MIRQVIKLEPNDSPVLFALRPILEFESVDKQFQPQMNEHDGSLSRSDHIRPVTIDYIVDSSMVDDMTQAGEAYPSRSYLANLKRMPADLRDKIRPWPW